MFTRCDDIFPAQKCSTYVNQSLNQVSCIDYFLVSAGCCVNSFVVLDSEVNFSDHLPLMMNFSTSYMSPPLSLSVVAHIAVILVKH